MHILRVCHVKGPRTSALSLLSYTQAATRVRLHDTTNILTIFSTSTTMATTKAVPELPHVLERLGLSTYSAVLASNGFHNWETVLDITEDDLAALNFKLGHRRKLQREIAKCRGLSAALALEIDDSPSDHQTVCSPALDCLTRQITTPPPRGKRRYRRHPKPDSHAPKKPKTACTLLEPRSNCICFDPAQM
jgi:hypothetical protein